jgi:hypothetical protein
MRSGLFAAPRRFKGGRGGPAYKRLPFTHCAISFQPFEDAVSAPASLLVPRVGGRGGGGVVKGRPAAVKATSAPYNHA